MHWVHIHYLSSIVILLILKVIAIKQVSYWLQNHGFPNAFTDTRLCLFFFSYSMVIHRRKLSSCSGLSNSWDRQLFRIISLLRFPYFLRSSLNTQINILTSFLLTSWLFAHFESLCLNSVPFSHRNTPF